MIHETAIVSPEAKISEDVQIGAYAIIEKDVEIGQDTKIGAFSLCLNGTRIGRDCKIYNNVTIGGEPQIKGWKPVQSYVVIGDRNVIREYVTIHRSSIEGSITVIGDDNFIMATTHIAHNCQIGSGVIMTNYATLAGHVIVEDRAVISGLAAIHQFVRIGRLAMVGGGSKVTQDVPPYITVDGHPAAAVSLNTVGLQRSGISSKVRQDLKSAYRFLYRSHLNITQALAKIEEEIPSSPEITHLLEFIKSSQRGIC
ncbi:MAG: acyl-ACP--UDP-N-acetylglucosamine O-acyltransferase [bacterium]|nr:acyl-ACP--UDP-N-acetylglucosamine O-acyltransferase [bacterium]